MKTHLLSFLVTLFLCTCQAPHSPENNDSLSIFTGSPEAVSKANQLFAAIGGKERWAALRSLYIKATHEQPELEQPYQSEIWRSLDTFRIRIEQQSPEFHRRAFFGEKEGWIVYVDRDSARQLSPEALAGWQYSHSRNVYVLLHQLAGPGSYEVKQEGNGRLQFYQDTTFLCAFETDEQGLPAVFITRSMEGEEQATHFTRFDTTQGLVHSAGGGPADGSFTYKTEEWIPSGLSVETAFEEVDFVYRKE